MVVGEFAQIRRPTLIEMVYESIQEAKRQDEKD